MHHTQARLACVHHQGPRIGDRADAESLKELLRHITLILLQRHDDCGRDEEQPTVRVDDERVRVERMWCVHLCASVGVLVRVVHGKHWAAVPSVH